MDVGNNRNTGWNGCFSNTCMDYNSSFNGGYKVHNSNKDMVEEMKKEGNNEITK